jgi:alcohol dehydrogenase (cytochrome c)
MGGDMKLLVRIVGLAGGVSFLSALAFAQSGPSAPVMGAVNGITLAPHALADYAAVTDATLRNPDPSDWIMMRGNYQGWGFSPLSQINKSNVKGLQLVWARGMEPGVNEATPIIHDGVMFLGNPGDVIQAIDAATGDLLWQYRRNLPSREALHSSWGQRKRSVFLYHDKVYFATWDNYLVALDAKSGREVWEVNRGGDLYATNTTGPIVVDGVVIAGASCQIAAFGCYVTGNDAETGKELWRNTFIPKPGEPGDETWGKVPFDKRWITGAWGPITYDPELNLAFYGSTGIGPASEAQRGQIGMSLAGTDTRFAVDPKTGKIAWKHQVLPEDNWDQDCTFEMLSITTAVHPDPKAEGMLAVGRRPDAARRKTLTGVPCKTGIVWSFDAAKGDFLWAKATVEQNLVDKIDPKGLVSINQDVAMRELNKVYHQCPSHAGGRDAQFTAYSPHTNALYIQLQNSCEDASVRADNIPSQPRAEYNTHDKYMLSKGKTNYGRLDAVSVETGKTLWSWESVAANRAPVLATAGGILFNGGMDRYFRAFDQDTGKVIWQTRLGSQAFGTPVAFSVKGRQYIAVAAGGGMNASSVSLKPEIDQLTGSNMVYVFALSESPGQ